MSLLNLQKKIGVTADGAWGPGTLKAATAFYKLTPARAAHFFGQVAHESGNFKAFTENLNYSATALNSVFPKYFVRAGRDAAQYERQPEKIANVVYANRMGNGGPESGDGWKYRGRGALQLTGKDNYNAFAQYLGKPEIMSNPDLVATTYAFESAIFFFEKNNLWAICDQGVNEQSITALTKRVNGGTHGLEDRKEKTKKYFSWLTGKTSSAAKAPAATPAPAAAPAAAPVNNAILAPGMLSQHFSLKEMTRSETATRKGIDNTPNATHLANLQLLCQNILEPVRNHFKKPIQINSAYRGPKLNAAVGGSAKSQHCNGEAVDFEIDGMSNHELAKWVAQNLNFDQVILEFYDPKEGPNSGWVHCSYSSSGKQRKSILTATRVKGKTVYKPGFVV